MLKEISVNLNNFLLSLSDAVDLASPSIATHQIRTAFIAWQISKSCGLDKERIERVFTAALLHDIGALTPEDKVRLHRFEEINIETHCIRGEFFFRLCPFLSHSAGMVRLHHTPWEEFETSLDDPDVLESQIIYTADLVERLIVRDRYILHQVEDIGSKIASCARSEINAEVIDLFMGLSKQEDFWLDLTSPRLYSVLLHFGPFRKIEIDYDQIFSLAVLLRSIIDFRSKFTSTHSTGVTECAVILSRIFGLTEPEISAMEIAGSFHDLGKLAVPNSILEKPAGLTKDEFAIIKQHTYFTYTVLTTIGGLDQIAEWAAFHHEKLDGTGYPFHIKADRMSTGARIMAVADIFTALAEDRPYRKGMGRKEIERILSDYAKRGLLDERITRLLMDNYDEVASRVKEKQQTAKEHYEKRFPINP